MSMLIPPKRLPRAIALSFAVSALNVVPAHAALVDMSTDKEWVFSRDLTSAQMSENYAQYRNAGYIMTDIDAYAVGSSARYAVNWQKNVDHRQWAEVRDMTSAQYSAKWQEYDGKGYRPVDVESYVVNGVTYWAGIWIQNIEGIGSRTHRGQSASDYASQFVKNSGDGYRLVDLEVANTSNGLRYTSLWERNVNGYPWAATRDMSRTEYQNALNSRSADGFKLVDLESYQMGGEQAYAAVWVKQGNLAWRVRSDRTEQDFVNLNYQYADEGMRLVDFERYSTEDGVRYAGVWAEHNDRYRYTAKNDLNAAITSYLDINNLPGISVAIIRDGETLYRRGFGFADVQNGKTAHGKTVYNAASVAKIIGGTLAAKLEDEEALRDGTTFNLDLSNKTSTYINNLPVEHTHTVEQLLSHLGCMPHYSTNPSIPNQTTHYSNATDAMQSIWDKGLIVGCVPNTQWNYSTHAFTFVGAVLESVTGKTINDLVNKELLEPYHMGSMRIMYNTASLPANSLRAVPYVPRDPVHSSPSAKDFIDPPDAVSNPNIPTSYSDSSWKVLGGGIETNAIDLARFGWKVLDGEIISPLARDTRLWQRVNPSFTQGLAWDLRNDPAGRNVAEWNGTWPGSRTYLRAYPNDGLVIAIMSNRTVHRTDLASDVDDLTNTLGEIVLP
jgi:CubicO group peptidase (beta-lactamase class C family)